AARTVDRPGTEASQERRANGDAVKGGPETSRLYEEAVALYSAGRYPEALETIRRAVDAGGTTTALHSLAGWCRLKGGDPQAAGSEFGAALALDPGAIEPQVGFGYVLLRRGEPRPAAIRFEAALARDPGNLDALKGLGLAQRDQKKYDEAAATFRRARRLAPADG